MTLHDCDIPPQHAAAAQTAALCCAAVAYLPYDTLLPEAQPGAAASACSTGGPAADTPKPLLGFQTWHPPEQPMPSNANDTQQARDVAVSNVGCVLYCGNV